MSLEAVTRAIYQAYLVFLVNWRHSKQKNVRWRTERENYKRTSCIEEPQVKYNIDLRCTFR